jgi:hypothetical protein
VKAPAPVPCPQCGTVLELVTDGQIGEAVMLASHPRGQAPVLRWTRAPFAACPACEFCIAIEVRS